MASINLTTQLLHWAPRVLCILFTLFLSIFAFDVFQEGHSWYMTLLAFFMHLLPAFLVLLLLVLAWRHEVLGGIGYIGLGVLYLVWAWGRFPWSVYVVISGPLFLIGCLYLADWFLHKHGSSPTPPLAHC